MSRERRLTELLSPNELASMTYCELAGEVLRPTADLDALLMSSSSYDWHRLAFLSERSLVLPVRFHLSDLTS